MAFASSLSNGGILKTEKFIAIPYTHFSWIKKNNIGNVEKLHIDDVINLYDEIYEHVPKKVFLASSGL